ncbi:hypothetical protein PS1M3_19300 [Pseudoalteromonas sp. PS1M3]|uniref:DUF2303 family protein n=1 Tax=Pseudoalteromonas sp. PS1M3 TaxID=87791 RepID=UPI0019510794|nr:DUF2303 family protein [Pseudoalteromonas sp. PS1M3]BBW91843.1 hypothetical protein PS1M3_19300 [Pseudoalteromonas sp. PS1M3]
MLDKKALEHIAESANIPDLIEQVKGTKNPLAVLPSSFELQSLEQFMPNRTSYRGTMETNSVADFFSYCKDYAEEGSKCFVDDSMAAVTIFDMGTESAPKHMKHKSILTLKKMSAYKELLSNVGSRMSQKDLSDFIEDLGDYMAINSTTESAMTIAQAAQAVKSVTIEQIKKSSSVVGDFDESQEDLHSIGAKNKDSLPAYIRFSCTPYSGLLSREFIVRVSIMTGYEKPIFNLRIIKHEQHIEEMAEEFKSLVIEGLESTEIKTFIGSF